MRAGNGACSARAAIGAVAEGDQGVEAAVAGQIAAIQRNGFASLVLSSRT